MVPDVYRISAGSSGTAAFPGQVEERRAKSTSTGAAPESRRMCSRSAGPASGGSGTQATPASSPPTTAATVSREAVAVTAKAGAPAMSAATAPAAPSRSS